MSFVRTTRGGYQVTVSKDEKLDLRDKNTFDAAKKHADESAPVASSNSGFVLVAQGNVTMGDLTVHQRARPAVRRPRSPDSSASSSSSDDSDNSDRADSPSTVRVQNVHGTRFIARDNAKITIDDAASAKDAQIDEIGNGEVKVAGQRPTLFEGKKRTDAPSAPIRRTIVNNTSGILIMGLDNSNIKIGGVSNRRR